LSLTPQTFGFIGSGQAKSSVQLVLQIFHLQVIEAQGTSPMLGWLLSMNVTEEEKIMYDET